MAKCDICGESCSAYGMAELRPLYQIDGVKDMCPKCEKWTEEQLNEARAKVAPEVRQRIATRVVGTAPKLSLFRRIFRLGPPVLSEWT